MKPLVALLLSLLTGCPAYSAPPPGPVLVMGDSIFKFYTPYLQQTEPCVEHIPDNGRDTAYTLANLDNWIYSKPYSVIYFNAGIWDAGEGVPLDVYAANLRQIAARVKQSGALPIFAATTPVPHGLEGRWRIRQYNRVAQQVMAEQGIAVDDLYSLMIEFQCLHLPGNVHYVDAGSWMLAQHVAATLHAAGFCQGAP